MWTYVDSSNVRAIAREGNDLKVLFINGGQYIYYGAGEHFEEIINASSIGKYLHHNIKNVYDYKKL